MAFDSYDLVVPPDYGDVLCIPCARTLRADHPEWDDPEDGDGNMRPVFDIDEVPMVESCGNCGYVSEYGSFGPEAVDYGLEVLERNTQERRRTPYADEYARRLRLTCLGDATQTARGEAILDAYEAIPTMTEEVTS